MVTAFLQYGPLAPSTFRSIWCFLHLQESASEKAKRKANREIKEMAERLSADQSIIVRRLPLEPLLSSQILS